MCAVSRAHGTTPSSTEIPCGQSCEPLVSATFTCESSEACATRNAILRTWAGAIRRRVTEADQIARQKRSVIMCAEAVPWRCHRPLIADALIVRNIRVEHIMREKTSRVHSLTSFGRVRRKRITYPLRKPPASSKISLLLDCRRPPTQ